MPFHYARPSVSDWLRCASGHPQPAGRPFSGGARQMSQLPSTFAKSPFTGTCGRAGDWIHVMELLHHSRHAASGSTDLSLCSASPHAIPPARRTPAGSGLAGTVAPRNWICLARSTATRTSDRSTSNRPQRRPGPNTLLSIGRSTRAAPAAPKTMATSPTQRQSGQPLRRG